MATSAMTAYFDNLCTAMDELAWTRNVIFMGQAVSYPGTGMYRTLEKVPDIKRLELPVFEDCQLGMAIGMSLNGFIPVCIYPRINFMLLAINQLVLHLDKLPIYSGYRPHVIIRTAIATDKPLDPGVQHLGNYTDAIRGLVQTVRIVELEDPNEIVPAYKFALEERGAHLIIERSEMY